MARIWDEYKHIRCGDFIKWWNKLTTKEKIEWRDEKEKIDVQIEKELWEREIRRSTKY